MCKATNRDSSKQIVGGPLIGIETDFSPSHSSRPVKNSWKATLNCCITLWKMKEWISGGWTGNRVHFQKKKAWTRSGCLTTFIFLIQVERGNGVSPFHDTPDRGASGIPLVSQGYVMTIVPPNGRTRLLVGTVSTFSPSSPLQQAILATVGGQMISEDTIKAPKTTNYTLDGSSLGVFHLSCACILQRALSTAANLGSLAKKLGVCRPRHCNTVID